ncbi:MAG: selenocysteine-specific translation elongation factor [Pirellulaceae bacterium]|nr:MAG: selenocysteine-specific translation elongation factor [Pirellulaceae bacterium]
MTTLPDGRRYRIVGVTGHIDHGKTRLVGALTGVDTDRHPEEKQRGITIDLGFAALEEDDQVLAFVDAPGHQRYVSNLLAGVSGVDIGLLVVAADQGIQAQTLEHTAILHSLGVPRLVVAMTRIDLATDEQIEALREELEVFLVDWGFERFPVIAVSSHTGAGLDALKRTLCDLEENTAADRVETRQRPFRMPIDRVLHVPGRGLVVAGCVWEGKVAVGDHVGIAGERTPLRVRSIEVHGQDQPQSFAGLRTAINLVGDVPREVVRGDELIAAEGHLLSPRLLVELNVFPGRPAIKPGVRLLMHTGTGAQEVEVQAPRTIASGERGPALIIASRPLVATWGQPLLLRLPHPIGCFAGGRVLASLPPTHRWKRRQLWEAAERLAGTAAPADRLASWVEMAGYVALDDAYFLQWARSAVGDPASWKAFQASMPTIVWLPNHLASQSWLQGLAQRVSQALGRHRQRQADSWMHLDALQRHLAAEAPAEIVQYVVQIMTDQQRLARVENMIAEVVPENALSKKQRAQLEKLLVAFRDNRMPPTLNELAQHLATTVDQTKALVRYAIDQGFLVDVGKGFLIGRSVLNVLCYELQELLNERQQVMVAEVRDRWQLTRKHTIPLLEYFDRQGITRREGDFRKAGPNMATNEASSPPQTT